MNMLIALMCISMRVFALVRACVCMVVASPPIVSGVELRDFKFKDLPGRTESRPTHRGPSTGSLMQAHICHCIPLPESGYPG